MILGIDEVGRGPWAGPLVVAAVVLGDSTIDGLADSKKLTAKKRNLLSQEILKNAAAVGLGWVHADELDSIGLGPALALATRRAVEQITVPYHEIIIDGTTNFLKGTTKESFVSLLPKADSLIASVSAASIVAKVARDRFMTEQAVKYPEYGFERHMGYGTALHSDALALHGVTPLHRRSFAPIATLLGAGIASSIKASHSTTSVGNRHEQAVATLLEQSGHNVLDRNWRNRWCEIDIVSERGGVLYFTEVRYRRTNGQGGGIGSITPAKLAKMMRAAEMYVSNQQDRPRQLQVASVDREGAISLLQIE
jgi:ribonuclease HII